VKREKVLLCGLGNMGSVHKKYLTQLNIEHYWYDPYVDLDSPGRITSLSEISKKGIGSVIIATPEGTHYDLYKKIRKISKKINILVEKPAVTSLSNFDMFEDSRVWVGLVERFNPAVQKLKSLIEIDKVINVDFVRCSISKNSNQRVSSFVDVGIHDVDLMHHLVQNQVTDYKVDRVSNTFSLITNHEAKGVICRFLWSNETFSKERKITVRQNNCTYEADLIDQTVKKYSSPGPPSKKTINGTVCENLYVEKSSPVKEQMKNFLSKKPVAVSGKESHWFYLEIIERVK
tara:strand:- start:1255 stop:2121 length:867 start_codon:yes stop_codon:yes gene_type:complete